MKERPIAMKCTQEQFEMIKPKLDKNNLHFENIKCFKEDCYLKNNSAQDEKAIYITNIPNKWKSDLNRTVYETWNERIFLEACGIEVEVEETYQITKEQILDLYSIQCTSDKNDVLESLFPDVFKQL